MGEYIQLTHHELRKKVGDALYSEAFGNPLSEEAEKYWREFELKYPLQDAPEGWEKELEAKLMEELPPGIYEIGTPGIMVAQTGKGGYIQYLIALRKAGLRYK